MSKLFGKITKIKTNHGKQVIEIELDTPITEISMNDLKVTIEEAEPNQETVDALKEAQEICDKKDTKKEFEEIMKKWKDIQPNYPTPDYPCFPHKCPNCPNPCYPQYPSYPIITWYTGTGAPFVKEGYNTCCGKQ